MNDAWVEIVELAAWGFDETPFRPKLPQERRTGCSPVARRAAHTVSMERMDHVLSLYLEPILARRDLQDEFRGLSWSIRVVDLRCLLAFQRRLVFDPAQPSATLPKPDDWPGLLALAFGPPRPASHRWIDEQTLESANPDLQLRRNTNGALVIHGGSPFLEVSILGERALLRDGYHRAWNLLRAGIFLVPAVVLQANSPADVYPAEPWFFPEAVLMGQDAPHVTDFLDPERTLRYRRPRTFTTLMLSDEEAAELKATKELIHI